MKIGVPKETADGERRVALVPDVVKSLKKNEKLEVLVERGAGDAAGHPDSQYSEAGAEVVEGEVTWGADVVLRVAVPTAEEIGRLNSNQVLIGHLAPWTAAETNKALAAAGVTSFAMEAIPRTTRAQAMDALSSQAAAAGYAATLIAARESGRFFGMMTTAAGTVPPAKVLVLGAGVAGLQAVATAKRLGAIVTGFDIRRAAWEQIASLGGRPLELDFIPDAEGEGGYARPLTDEENAQVRDALGENAAKQDVIVTTAAIPGRPAPLLITADAVRGMAARLGDRRPRRRDRRQLRADRGRRDRGRERRQGDRPAQPRQRDAGPGLPALRQEPREPARPAGHRGGRAQGRLRGRHRRRRLHHPRRRDQEREGGEMSLMTEITIFVLAAFVGFEVISKVPTTLHTPLMSQTNAIHGIVMLGGLIVVGYANDPLEYVIGTIAIAFGAINIVGGFMVTDRMLGMFSKKPKPKADADGKGGA